MERALRPIVDYLRANPQAAILLAICIILGLGTMLAVVISLGGSGDAGSTYGNGAVIMGFRVPVGF